jgi:hypothetical protein
MENLKSKHSARLINFACIIDRSAILAESPDPSNLVIVDNVHSLNSLRRLITATHAIQ